MSTNSSSWSMSTIVGPTVTFSNNTWASSSTSSTNYWYVSDPSVCQHCEEKLEQAKVGKERFCSPECESAYTVAQRLGGGNGVAVQGWMNPMSSSPIVYSTAVYAPIASLGISASTQWTQPIAYAVTTVSS